MTGYEKLSSILYEDSILESLALGGIFIAFPETFNVLPVVSYSSTIGEPLSTFGGGRDVMSYFSVDIWSTSQAGTILIGDRVKELLTEFIVGLESDLIEDKLHHKSIKFNILN